VVISIGCEMSVLTVLVAACVLSVSNVSVGVMPGVLYIVSELLKYFVVISIGCEMSVLTVLVAACVLSVSNVSMGVMPGVIDDSVYVVCTCVLSVFCF
jgi:hypothetical protein